MKKINKDSTMLSNLDALVPPDFSEARGAYDSPLLLKALSIAGAGRSLASVLNGPDSAHSSLERDLRATCGPFVAATDLLEARGSGILSATPPLSETELAAAYPLVMLEDLARIFAGSNSAEAEFANFALEKTAEIAYALGVSEPTASDVRLVAGAVALGVFGDEHEVPCSYWPGIASGLKNTFSALASIERELPGGYFPAVVLERTLRTGALHGFGNIPGYCEIFGSGDAKEVASVVVGEIVEMSRNAVSTLTESDIVDTPGRIGVPVLTALAGRTPEDARFWIPDEMFAPGREFPKMYLERNSRNSPLRAIAYPLLSSDEREAYRTSIASLHGDAGRRQALSASSVARCACSCASELATRPRSIAPEGASGRRSGVYEDDVKVGNSLVAMSMFLSGRFDTFRFDRGQDTFFSYPGDVDVPSTFETPGFRKRMESLSQSGPFGERIFRAFLIECVSALSIPSSVAERNPDLWKEKNEVLPVASDVVVGWLKKHSGKIVNCPVEWERYVRIPIIPSLAGARCADGRMLAVLLAEKSVRTNGGTMPFPDGIAATKLLGDEGFAKALLSNYEDARVFLLSAADSVFSFDPEKDGGKSARNELVSGDILFGEKMELLRKTVAEYVGAVSKLRLAAPRSNRAFEELFAVVARKIRGFAERNARKVASETCAEALERHPVDEEKRGFLAEMLGEKYGVNIPGGWDEGAPEM